MTGELSSGGRTPLYAEYDADGALIAASPEFVGAGDAQGVGVYLKRFVEIDGDRSRTRASRAAKRLLADGHTIEARAASGEWRLLTSHPTAAGGRCLVAVDITHSKSAGAFAQAMMEHHPLPVWANDAETGEVVFSSERAREAFEADDDTYKTWRIGDFFVDPEDSLRILEELRERGRIENYLVKVRSTSKREVWVSGAATLFEHGGRTIALSAIQDLTTQKEHERESRRSLDMLNDALRALPVAFALFDEDERLVLCNDQFRELNAAISEFTAPGVHWETMVRELANRRVARHAIGRENAWVAEILGLSEGFKSFEIDRTDGAHMAVSVRPTSLGGFIVTQSDVSNQRQAEDLARSSEEMLSKILQASPANLCMSRIGDGEVIYQSPSCAAVFGTHASAKDQFADRGERADFLTELLPSGHVDNYRADARAADGRRFPALFSARVIAFKGEDVMVSTVTDLTEQQAAQRAILEAGTRLRDAIESLDEGFALYDAERRLVLWNSRYDEMNTPFLTEIKEGATHAELIDALIASGVLDDEQIAHLRAHPPQQGEPKRFELRFKDGSWRMAAHSPTSDGGFVVTLLDITENKRAEAAQREANEIMRCVVEACPISVTMTGFDTDTEVFRGGAALEMYGPHERPADYWVDGAERRACREALRRDGRVDDLQVRLRRTDGVEVPSLLSARTAEFRGEKVVVTFAFDLTERITMEEELAKQREMLHQSEKLSALGELLAGVAHELNNPLSVVVGHALMLQEEANDETLRRRADKIGVAAERCSKIVKTFLAMARQRPACLERVDVNGVIETALDVAGYSLKSSGAAVIADLADDLPAVQADPDQLAQVFANLIVNAEQALKELGADGVLTLSSALTARGDEIEITVADNGPGIPEAIRARIFEPFFTTKGVGEGTGVGLAFCHRIIECHHGRIAVDTAPGGGARFTIHLAVAKEDACERDNAPDIAAAAHGRALVVDDEADVAELLAQVLASDGFEVAMAASAEEALALLPGGYDVILSDLNMPGLGGRAILDKIRDDWPAMEQRLGFVTGDTMSAGVGEFLRSSGRPYLEKPAAPADIRRLAAQLADPAGDGAAP